MYVPHGSEMNAMRMRHFFSSAGQLTTSVMGADAASSARVFTRKRWPSGETSYMEPVLAIVSARVSPGSNKPIVFGDALPFQYRVNSR